MRNFGRSSSPWLHGCTAAQLHVASGGMLEASLIELINCTFYSYTICHRETLSVVRPPQISGVGCRGDPISEPPHLPRSVRGGVRVAKRWIDACRLAKDSNLRPLSVINTRSDLAEWPRATWYHIESLCPLPCIYIPIVLWSRPSVDPLTILLIKLLKSYSLVLKSCPVA
eukprot:SAG25_NODE_126_length_14581_cov_5.819569_8_plen_170_part_00